MTDCEQLAGELKALEELLQQTSTEHKRQEIIDKIEQINAEQQKHGYLEAVHSTVEGVSSYPTNDSSAKVVTVEGDEVALDATVFFPGAGGQIPDRGIMSWNNWQDEGNLIAMNKRDEVVWHTIDCLPPPLGTAVVGTIDWDPRYRMMRIVEYKD